MPEQPRSAELLRLADANAERAAWREWGPYVSERQWGTVREDYSATGDAWEYVPHDHARSRAYRWGEDGLAGVCDRKQRLCIALALWNGRDPILKERLFGLTNAEGNHGEDVKEIYYYLDATPTHSYLKYLYKHPQAPFPYERLVEENRRRDREAPEFELLDTGVFEGDRYFDVFVEYAKAAPDDILMRITAHNRGPDAAPLHILPQVWFRNTWSWDAQDSERPSLVFESTGAVVQATSPKLGAFRIFVDGEPDWIFTENDSNAPRLFGRPHTPGTFYKDAFHAFVVHADPATVNPNRRGTKAAAVRAFTIPAGGSAQVRLRLTAADSAPADAFADFDAVFAQRVTEADAFYADLQRDIADDDARRVHRQALAGMIWSKQVYQYDVRRWLIGDPDQPAPPGGRGEIRNGAWQHLANNDVISMPDKWEYPWYAAWDLAFHCLPLALVDAEFAKNQLILLTREWYMHPSGQLPAYEWEFSDVNPPVHAWAAWRVFQIDRKQRRRAHPDDCGDLAFLERVYHKLMLNFTWWVNRKDAHGRSVFQGGFLGMDNIGVFDRSKELPTGGHLDQADGTSWMAMYCLNLMRIALELAQRDPVYEDIASKFFEHFLYIAEAMTHIGGEPQDHGIGLWDAQDEFFYDVLHTPDGGMTKLRIRSMVGLIPLFAVETLEPELLERVPAFRKRMEYFLRHRPDLARLVSRWHEPGRGDRRLLSLLRGSRMKRLLRRMLDSGEFLGEFGVRSLSKQHEQTPYTFWIDGAPHTVSYEPAESRSGLFGGNSNWRGPIWLPTNYLIIESLQKFHHYYGDDFKIECPTGSGRFVTILDVADDLTQRLTRLVLRDESGRRPVFGGSERYQSDPHFRDYVLFYEYFHGDDGAGLGAAHQTGWTGLLAKLLHPRRPVTCEEAGVCASRA